jgi:hypothetical protein
MAAAASQRAQVPGETVTASIVAGLARQVLDLDERLWDTEAQIREVFHELGAAKIIESIPGRRSPGVGGRVSATRLRSRSQVRPLVDTDERPRQRHRSSARPRAACWGGLCDTLANCARDDADLDSLQAALDEARATVAEARIRAAVWGLCGTMRWPPQG